MKRRRRLCCRPSPSIHRTASCERRRRDARPLPRAVQRCGARPPARRRCPPPIGRAASIPPRSSARRRRPMRAARSPLAVASACSATRACSIRPSALPTSLPNRSRIRRPARSATSSPPTLPCAAIRRAAASMTSTSSAASTSSMPRCCMTVSTASSPNRCSRPNSPSASRFSRGRTLSSTACRCPVASAAPLTSYQSAPRNFRSPTSPAPTPLSRSAARTSTTVAATARRRSSASASTASTRTATAW